MEILLVSVCVALVAALVFWFWRHGRRSQAGKGSLTALVFLLSQRRVLVESHVREVSSRLFGADLSSGDHSATNWLISVPPEEVQRSIPAGAAQSFLIQAFGRRYLINSFGTPYMKRPEKFARSIPDLRLRSAVAGHRAWVSVDLFGEQPSEAERVEIYAELGKTLAAFAGDDCLAVYCPELERCNEYAPSVLEALQSGQPLTLFDEPTHAPVLQVDGEDPRMIAAVEEARRRWPQFVDAFQNNRDAEKPFVIKARFSDSTNTEFMWVSVRQIEIETVTGRLENSPASLQHIREGDTVNVPLSDLNDWLCEIDGEPQGAFTLKAIQEIQRAK